MTGVSDGLRTVQCTRTNGNCILIVCFVSDREQFVMQRDERTMIPWFFSDRDRVQVNSNVVFFKAAGKCYKHFSCASAYVCFLCFHR